MKSPLTPMFLRVLFCLEVHFLIVRTESTECSDTGTKQALQLNITCDSSIDVYIDGKHLGANEYPTVGKFVISNGSDVIAVKCRGMPHLSSGAILSSLSNGFVTDSTWKCTSKLEAGWNMRTFDDLDWSPATEFGSNIAPALPWGQKPDILQNAKFIWTADVNSDVVIYCRRALVTRCTENRFHFFTTKTEWKDKALNNWVLKTTIVRTVLECGMNCLTTPQCLSFNTEYLTTKKRRICELNKQKGVSSLSSRTGFQYFEIVKAGY